MKTLIQRLPLLLGWALLSSFFTVSANAATNAVTDPGGGGVSLTGSGNVTVNSTQLALVKQVYDNSGNCLASSPTDAGCNGGATTVTVPVGTQLKFMIFVRNSTAIALTDVRFQDALDETASGFTYAAGSLKYDSAQADNAAIAALYTAANGGTAQTDALGAPDDFASKVGGTITVGAVTGQANSSVSLGANKAFALLFRATKN